MGLQSISDKRSTITKHAHVHFLDTANKFENQSEYYPYEGHKHADHSD